MFDLIDECGKDLENFGYKIKRDKNFNLSYGFLSVDSNEKEKSLEMAKGDYFILNCPDIYSYDYQIDFKIIEKLSFAIKTLLKKMKIKEKSKVLIVGLGNPDIMCDRLGKEVFDNVKINAFSNNNYIFKFCPNIYFSTGIETLDMVKAFVDKININYVFVIDSLATKDISRLGTSFQITTTGISPGSAVNRFGKKIEKNSLKVPCLSIGVPFMIFANDLNPISPNDLILAPKDIKEHIQRVGFIIAEALNKVL